jgi:hypothetical protein
VQGSFPTPKVEAAAPQVEATAPQVVVSGPSRR